MRRMRLIVCPLVMGLVCNLGWGMVRAEERSEAAMGIYVGAVPAALGSHLELKDVGVMVRNVIKDSPADKAGLERYDVIVRLDGEEVADSPEEFAKTIRSRSPGDEMRLQIIRKGKKVDAAVTLAKPIAPDRAKYKYKEDPDEVWRSRVRLTPHVFRKAPEGWSILPEPYFIPGGVPPEFDLDAELVPGSGESYTLIIRKSSDGKRIEIERSEDAIKVSKFVKDDEGQETCVTQTYKTEDELRKADPETHKLYIRFRGPMGPTWHIRPPERMGDYRKAKEAVERSRDEMKKAMKEWEGKLKADLEGISADAERWKERFGTKFTGEIRGFNQFDVDEQGRIEVRIRKPEGSATLHFKDEQELKDKHPELYKQYKKILGTKE